MKTLSCVSISLDSKSRSCLCSLFVVASLIFGVYFISSALVGKDYQERLSGWKIIETLPSVKYNKCKNCCRPSGSEALPQGIVAKTSDYEMRPLWGSFAHNNEQKPSMSLLALAVGIRQKETVDQIVKKFPSSEFMVMLFHYDGVVDKWREYSWCDLAIHVSAVNQTKWWFAKRFLHPDIVAEYNYIFLWDEDLGVENFDPKRYLSIVKKEGLEISQPALDPAKSKIHHLITARQRNSKVHGCMPWFSTLLLDAVLSISSCSVPKSMHFPKQSLHRKLRTTNLGNFSWGIVEASQNFFLQLPHLERTYKFRGSDRCYDNSTAPPCIGWVEMMAPVFSKAAWRCTWYMIQNDLIHAWGVDKQLGYCAQGDRTKNVGVVDSEYIVHLGLPTLGVFNHSEVSHTEKHNNSKSAQNGLLNVDARPQVRQQSADEMQIFWKRWDDAMREDKCWVDPFQQRKNQTNH